MNLLFYQSLALRMLKHRTQQITDLFEFMRIHLRRKAEEFGARKAEESDVMLIKGENYLRDFPGIKLGVVGTYPKCTNPQYFFFTFPLKT